MRFILTLLIVLLFSCSNEDEESILLEGIVSHITSCSGGLEPVYIIKLSDTDSIMTANLSDEFQIPDLKIQFRTKSPPPTVFCTTDKVYPEQFDVYDVSVLID